MLSPEEFGLLLDDKIPGGMGDGISRTEAEDRFGEDAVEMGIQHELEHTDDVEIALEIAIDHLVEDPECYIKIKKIHESYPDTSTGGMRSMPWKIFPDDEDIDKTTDDDRKFMDKITKELEDNVESSLNEPDDALKPITSAGPGE